MKKSNVTTWQEVLKDVEPYPRLETSTDCDVVIIGGGMTGILTSYLLSKQGKKVVVIDKKTLKESVSAYTTAFLTYVIDTNLDNLIRMAGPIHAKKVYYSGRDAIDMFEKIIKEEKIECEWKRVPLHIFATDKSDFEDLRKDQERANKFDFPMKPNSSKAFPFEHEGSIEVPNQAKFHPMKFALALRSRAIELGARFYEHTEAVSISGSDPVMVKTKEGSIRAHHVVTATYNPFVQPWWFIFKKGMYISYVYELAIPKGYLKEGLYEDNENPYHYFRVDTGEMEDRLIIGGEDHREELPLKQDKSFSALRRYLRNTLHLNEGQYRIVHKWSGPILESTDGLPLIGRYMKYFPNRYVATAFSGNGMTYSMISAMILTNMIIGKDNNGYAPVYDPTRLFNLWDIIIKGRDYGGTFIQGALKNYFAYYLAKK